MIKQISIIEVFLIIGIISILGLLFFNVMNDDRPIKCVGGFSYRVGPEGELHLRTSGKVAAPVRCTL